MLKCEEHKALNFIVDDCDEVYTEKKTYGDEVMCENTDSTDNIIIYSEFSKFEIC